MTRLDRLFLAFLAVAIVGGSVLLPGCAPQQSACPTIVADRYTLLGIYKPKGFGITFDTATGDIGIVRLPPQLAQPESAE